MEKKMSNKILEEIKKRMDCLILINCKAEVSEKEKLKIAVNCLGLRETARLLEKDSGNLHRQINQKKVKNDK
ncbi:hypothetical protein KAT80_03285 [Candidatus Pacearchaeota archaeon]|nr:hypothetical protein [Candidatus Pacearchaeota archaeon]